MEYKNLHSYGKFLNEKFRLFESDEIEDKAKKAEADYQNKILVKDPNNPLDEAINSKIDLVKEKTDIYVKDEDGKQIYSAFAYRQLKLVDLKEHIIKLKSEYFINNEKGDENAQSGETNESLNEGFLKKMFDLAVKKTKLYASKIKASKKLDPIFEEATKSISKLFQDKKLVDGFKKANADKEQLKKQIEQTGKETGELVKSTSDEVENAANSNAQKETGEDAFKTGEIYTYENGEGTKVRVVITSTKPLEAIRVSDDDKTKKVGEQELRSEDEIKKDNEFKPDAENISPIGDDNKKDAENKLVDDIKKAKELIQK